MPQASQGQRAGWWPSYSSVADTNVRPRATSAKWSPTRERRSFFGELEVPKAAKAHVGPSAALPKPQFSRKISWEEHLDVLRVYVAREGHALVPLAHEERGVRLGAWLSKQWSEFGSDARGGYLSRNRRLRLEQAGVVFAGPAPPATGVVGSHALNERKWDGNRDYDMAAKGWHPRAFDASKPANEGEHWRAYSTETDPAGRRWLERQRQKGLAKRPAAPEKPYVPHGHPPVKGVYDTALANRLAKANEEMQKERGGKGAPTQ